MSDQPLMRDLLFERGVIYIHCDWHMNYFLRALLNAIFHRDNFLNECIWYYYNKMHDIRKPIFPRSHDTILSYAKLKTPHVFNLQSEKHDKPVTQLVRQKLMGEW
jgi:adenine specific DNA methylase Mod